MFLPTPLMIRSTEYEGRPTWTVAVTMPNGSVATRSFWVEAPTCPETHHVPTSLAFIPSTGEGFLFCDCGVDHLAKILFGGPLMARHYASNAGLRFETIPSAAEHRIDSDAYGDGSVPGEPDLDDESL